MPQRESPKSVSSEVDEEESRNMKDNGHRLSVGGRAVIDLSASKGLVKSYPALVKSLSKVPRSLRRNTVATIVVPIDGCQNTCLIRVQATRAAREETRELQGRKSGIGQAGALTHITTLFSGPRATFT
jgi:hypothetical protein